MQVPRLVLAGNSSGAGKTTVGVGLMAALRARGHTVQPFKCGPDYIDPGYHVLAAGRPSRNIDSWLISRPVLVDLVARTCAGDALAVVEGIMGLYDGRSSLGAAGSTAEIAKWLRAPVVLLLDVSRCAQSAGALAMGFREFDKEVQIVGVILNNITSPAHLARATEAVEVGAGMPVLGHLRYNPSLALPEQHPALLSEEMRRSLPDTIERIRCEVESTVDVGALLAMMRAAWPWPDHMLGGAFPPSPRPARVRLAVLRDEAFDLYLEDNLDLLAAWGAKLVPVSPLRDSAIPSDVDGLYVGPGWPELFAPALSANEPFLASVREAAAAGMPILGECGGAVYLSQGLVGQSGERHPLAGLLPGWSAIGGRMGPRLNYAAAEVARDCLLAKQGRRLQAYEFHWAATPFPADNAAFLLSDPEERAEGFALDDQLVTQLRLHFAADHTLARSFVERCARWATNKTRV
ncbi:MAG: cobyrinate a,c-diamide synthase [Chloroflexota bacterium]